MEEISNLILVPWDFSEIAANALAHATKFAKILDSDVELLNIVKKEKDVESNLVRLKAVAADCQVKYGINPGVNVKVGSIFESIKEHAKEIDARLVIMGTHGIKGMQKFTGSWALKVIVGSKPPFVVVQGPPSDDELKDIVFPIEFKSEDKEKLRWANYFSKFYRLKIQVVTPDLRDEHLLKKTKQNIHFAKKYFETKGIEYEINYLNETDFPKEVVKFAEKINAGMILIMTTPNISSIDFAFGANEQKMIANDAQIPVMCVNPRIDKTKPGDFRALGG